MREFITNMANLTISRPGGLMAVRADFFRELGEYDTGLEIWGGENVELSLKVSFFHEDFWRKRIMVRVEKLI